MTNGDFTGPAKLIANLGSGDALEAGIGAEKPLSEMQQELCRSLFPSP